MSGQEEYLVSLSFKGDQFSPREDRFQCGVYYRCGEGAGEYHPDLGRTALDLDDYGGGGGHQGGAQT